MNDNLMINKPETAKTMNNIKYLLELIDKVKFFFNKIEKDQIDQEGDSVDQEFVIKLMEFII